MVIDNERGKQLGHSHKDFTFGLGKYLWIRSYFMKNKNNYLSGKQCYKYINIWVSDWLTKNINNDYLVISQSVSIYENICSNFW